MLLDEDGYLIQCDWCGKHQDFSGRNGVEKYHKESDSEHRWSIWPEFFRIDYSGQRRGIKLPPEFPEHLCKECADELTPWVYRFADIALLTTYINNLWRNINEQRKQNRGTEDHGTASHHACQCSKGCNAGPA